ncbi:MAG: heavy metal translocating P-type ATPase [Planctomycetia bacterium]|nr:MAG: heavy metal translocating P-type ATPase [Planctomycetia bacterium]
MRVDRLVLRIHGMHCAEEVAAIRQELGGRAGVRALDFDILNAKLSATYEPHVIAPDSIAASIRKLGMGAEPWSEARAAPAGAKPAIDGRLIATIASGALLIVGTLLHAVQQGWAAVFGAAARETVPILAVVAYMAATVAGAWFVAPKAFLALRRIRADMNLLMTVAVVGAIAIGEYLEAAAVAFLFALSLTLEFWSVGRARRAVAALMALSPPRATVLSADGREESRDVTDVPVGSTVVIKPGEKFPLDGRITKGETTADQAPITGESRPVPKTVGDDVFAGTINEDGAVELITTKVAADTTLARITRMVGDAQAKRAPSEQWVETFARYYTPTVMLLAILVAAIPPMLFGGAFAYWIYQALVLLVIACPCALVISTPVSIVAALASAARHGVLIKGGLHVETPARLKAIALDKTGTLTEGQPQVQQVVPLAGHDERELLEIASAIEQRSEHPLARAIVRFADSKSVRPTPVGDYQTLKGKGATAMLNGNAVWIGSHRLLEERAQESPEMHAQLEALSAAGASIVVVGNDDHVCGFIAVSDRVRDASPTTVAALRAAGIEHVIMLTGDNHGTARAVAAETGVDEVRAELLPEQKVAAIEELVTRYGAVAMVGDGVNDAPALARSTLGIAMGAAGTDAALETADVALMSDDLSRLPWLIRHSRRTLNVIRHNIVASLTVKAAFILLTLAGYASLWAAIAADTGMSLVVVFNALRLLGERKTAAK